MGNPETRLGLEALIPLVHGSLFYILAFSFKNITLRMYVTTLLYVSIILKYPMELFYPPWSD